MSPAVVPRSFALPPARLRGGVSVVTLLGASWGRAHSHRGGFISVRPEKGRSVNGTRASSQSEVDLRVYECEPIPLGPAVHVPVHLWRSVPCHCPAGRVNSHASFRHTEQRTCLTRAGFAENDPCAGSFGFRGSSAAHALNKAAHAVNTTRRGAIYRSGH